MPFDCDLAVVGSGAGGATFAYACARAGKSVLLLERGYPYDLPGPHHDERAMLIDKKPYCDREIQVNGVGKRLYAGGSLGGGFLCRFHRGAVGLVFGAFGFQSRFDSVHVVSRFESCRKIRKAHQRRQP